MTCEKSAMPTTLPSSVMPFASDDEPPGSSPRARVPFVASQMYARRGTFGDDDVRLLDDGTIRFVATLKNGAGSAVDQGFFRDEPTMSEIVERIEDEVLAGVPADRLDDRDDVGVHEVERDLFLFGGGGGKGEKGGQGERC